MGDMRRVLRDRKVPVKLKGMVYKTAVRQAMLYGIETLPVKRTDESRLNVEDRMLPWMGGVTKEERVRNEYIRGSIYREVKEEKGLISIEDCFNIEIRALGQYRKTSKDSNNGG
ncbi:uncharacterized protein [Palaemon carinicauda]|uniref:uncharacterized protein n=1 Tax=Palaemon carinicauda TaxID=392227 RepID=UPI0035B68CEB